MTDLYDLILVFLIGVASGITNVIAKGGSIIALPSLILLGYSGVVANGTNRVALFIINLFALKTFYNRDRTEFNRSLRYVFCAIPGAILGTVAAIEMSDVHYRFILGILLLLVAASIFLKPSTQPTTSILMRDREWLVYLLMFGIGLYGGFAQAGVAIPLAAVLSYLLGMDKIRSEIYQVSILFAYLFPTSLILIWTKHVDWTGGFVLLAGYIAGSWIGGTSFISSKQSIVRLLLALATVIMALKLLDIY